MRGFAYFTSVLIFSGLAYGSDFERQVTFESTFDCLQSSRLHQSYCIASRPKDFTTSERERVLAAIDDLPPRAQWMLEQVIDRWGPLNFRRTLRGATPMNHLTYKANPETVAWIERSQRNTIGLTDRFFSEFRMINADYSFDSYVLLHEIVHLFDKAKGRVSQTPEFLKLAGWREVKTGSMKPIGSIKVPETRWELIQVPTSELEEINKQITDLHGDGWSQEAIDLNLQFAAKHGFPTTYAMTNPYESFAELLTNLILDPPIMDSVDSELLHFLSTLLKEN